MLSKLFFNTSSAFFFAIIFGLISGFLDLPSLYLFASAISDIFMSLLKLVSVPLIFLSIVATVSGMNPEEFKILGKRVVQYSVLTTFLSAVVALLLFLVINPVQTQVEVINTEQIIGETQGGYWDYLIKSIPANIITPFSESQVMGVLFLAMLFAMAMLALPAQNRKVLNDIFSSLYAVIMKITTWIVQAIPLAVWSFITLFIRDMKEGLEVKSLALYLICVLVANLLQAIVVLPILLKMQGVSPIKLFKGMFPALSLAFFTKSSSATLPTAMQCAEERLGMPKKITSFAFPLCTTINMNGCSAFILITVLFVSMSHGATYTLAEMAIWTVIASIAALGNAGVPMGCYFLSGALLATMNVPLQLLGVILPFYALVDMVETAVNVWSDSCVVAVVEKQVSIHEPIGEPILVGQKA